MMPSAMMISFCVCFINTAENNCRCMPNSTNVIQLSKKEKNYAFFYSSKINKISRTSIQPSLVVPINNL